MGFLEKFKNTVFIEELMGNKLEEIRYEENRAIAHDDERRTIYEPEKILDRLEGTWHEHNIIAIKGGGFELGNHYHDYQEVFFTPTGIFDFRFVDLEDLETRKFTLNAGSRILIPERIGYVITGNKGSILIGYGNVPFNLKRLISCPQEAIEAMASIKTTEVPSYLHMLGGVDYMEAQMERYPR